MEGGFFDLRSTLDQYVLSMVLIYVTGLYFNLLVNWEWCNSLN